ncbi:5-hydroxyisourate hydrolase-like [Cynoglossus semilaevis]|uniref:5-hydroxyisourate hydrolase-like n=1 Tax=Cynoglossus semilaevis TaxID=244447 RepID=UPI0004970A8D|nr:5-hydroxyisourate hydrolase-like [Cynoglossus semilaevis]XP_024911995.1 5-hydroxyisourate hydrolase-like [Cynoglossus semilaevis]
MAAAATASGSSPLSIHVLNTGGGIPAIKMDVSLHRLSSELIIWNMLGVGLTDENGCCLGMINREDFTPGMYKVRFETSSYWESLCLTSIHPYIEVVFTIRRPEQRLHLNLLISGTSYYTYIES